MKGTFFLKGFGAFVQEVRVTEQTVKDVPVREGDEVIVQVRATVSRVLPSAEAQEIDLTNIRPHKIVQVIRAKATG